MKAVLVMLLMFPVLVQLQAGERPNILFVVSDDQSWPHAGAYGDASVETPAFDRIADEGVLFTHCFCSASQCSPARASLLTGRNIWQLEEAGTHASIFPKKFEVYPEILEKAGYFVGYTGKPWAPGSWKDGGRSRNPAGEAYNDRKLVPPLSKISSTDYVENFRDFLGKKPEENPFCFWFGCVEPHRDYELNSGRKAGKDVSDIEIPAYAPDHPVTRNDLLDYKLEIEWFDQQLAAFLQMLEERGELDNTLIIVTSDNGMPFPRAKANLYDAGTRMPLAVRWGDRVPAGRLVDDFVSFVDFAPTFLEAAGIEIPVAMEGRSFLKILQSEKSGRIEADRDFVVMGKERHNQARPDNVGYPIRALRNDEFLFLRNFKPDRWPLGDPPYYFCHTKLNNPTKDFILEHKDEPEYRRFYNLTYAKRPARELYNIRADPDCIYNLIDDPLFADTAKTLETQLRGILEEQGDPRVIGTGDIFESYPYYQRIYDAIPGFKEYGKYNPAFMGKP